MTVLSILTDALQAIPPKVRQGLLVVFAAAVVVDGALQLSGVDTGSTDTVLLYVGGYLGVQSAANVKQKPTPVIVVDGQRTLFDLTQDDRDRINKAFNPEPAGHDRPAFFPRDTSE